MGYPDGFSGRACDRGIPLVQRPSGERTYQRTPDDVLRRTRANLIDREGVAMWIDAWGRDRMISEIDREIALRATTTPTE